MIMNKLFDQKAILILVLLFLLFPVTTYADGVFDSLKERIAEFFIFSVYSFLNNFLSELIVDLKESLNLVLFTPTEIDKLLAIKHFLIFFQWVAAIWIPVVATINGASSLSSQWIGSQYVEPQEIIGRAVFAEMMVWFFPWFLENFILKINNLLVEAILSFPIDGVNTAMVLLTPQTAIGYLIFVVAIYTITFLILLIQSLIRYAEIMVFYLASPIVATSLAYRGEMFSFFFKELLAVVFTQVYHVAIIHLLFSVMLGNNMGFMSYLIGIGFLIVAIKGSTALKGWLLYSTGTGRGIAGAGGQVSRMAVYRYMAKSFVPS